MLVSEVDAAVFEGEESKQHAGELYVVIGDGAGRIVGGYEGELDVFGSLDLPQKGKDGMRSAAPYPAGPQFARICVCDERWWLLYQLEDGGGVTGKILYEYTPICQRLL